MAKLKTLVGSSSLWSKQLQDALHYMVTANSLDVCELPTDPAWASGPPTVSPPGGLCSQSPNAWSPDNYASDIKYASRGFGCCPQDGTDCWDEGIKKVFPNAPDAQHVAGSQERNTAGGQTPDIEVAVALNLLEKTSKEILLKDTAKYIGVAVLGVHYEIVVSDTKPSPYGGGPGPGPKETTTQGPAKPETTSGASIHTLGITFGVIISMLLF